MGRHRPVVKVDLMDVDTEFVKDKDARQQAAFTRSSRTQFFGGEPNPLTEDAEDAKYMNLCIYVTCQMYISTLPEASQRVRP